MGAEIAESSHLNPQAGGRENKLKMSLLKHQSLPLVTDLLQQGHTPSLSQIVPPPGTQAFTHVSLLGTFSFKPPQPLVLKSVSHFINCYC